jgi:hypothetical protein
MMSHRLSCFAWHRTVWYLIFWIWSVCSRAKFSARCIRVCEMMSHRLCELFRVKPYSSEPYFLKLVCSRARFCARWHLFVRWCSIDCVSWFAWRLTVWYWILLNCVLARAQVVCLWEAVVSTVAAVCFDAVQLGGVICSFICVIIAASTLAVEETMLYPPVKSFTPAMPDCRCVVAFGVL